MINSFLNIEELKKIGIKKYGENVLISRFACLYNPEKLIIGNNVRIDDFCILTGEIFINSYVHISAYTAIYGKGGVVLENFTGLSPRVTIFSATDDFKGEFLIGPMVEIKYRNIIEGRVLIKKYSQIGSGSIIFPNITINDGVSVGALSLVNKDLEQWTIYAGVPAKKIKTRKRDLLKFIRYKK